MYTSSKAKKRVLSATRPAEQPKQQAPSLEELLAARDYVGAVTLLRFKRQHDRSAGLAEWLAYANFRAGEHEKALAVYQELLLGPDPDPLYHTYAAACCFYLGLTQQAEEEALQGPRCPLATRILFHCAHARGDDDALMAQHSSLSSSLEDQLSLAALHFNRGHYQEAADAYKALLLDHRDLLALNVYVALCYSKLDFFDVSTEILQLYLNTFPASTLGVNLKACNAFRLQDGKAALSELRGLADATAGKHAEHDLIRHNLVVFSGGDNALQVLPSLGDVPPEARLNLAIHQLRQGGDKVAAADALLRDVSPSTPHEHILKGIVALLLGQASGSQEQLKAAQQHFQVVGSSPTECDTIPGRQAMASCFFLLRQWDDVLVFLSSIKSYFAEDEAFNFNYGLALAATGKHQEAAAALGAAHKHRFDPVCMQWRTRCLVFSGQPRAAWELFTQAQASGEAAAAGEAGYMLLLQLGNDCYRVGAFYTALKAFDVLERLDPTPELWEAKRGAACGVLQAIAAGREEPEVLAEVLELMRATGGSSGGATALQVEQVCRVMRHWGQMQGLL